MPRTLYTLGTSTRSLDEFLEIMDGYGIQGIVDVRRFPVSNRYPHFSRHHLGIVAAERAFVYQWLGDLLGGFRKGGYAVYQEDASYGRGLEELESIATKMKTVIICAERFPWKCHRLQISRSMRGRGWEVIHIIDRVRAWQPKDLKEQRGAGPKEP